MTLCPTNPTAEKMLIAEQTYPVHPIELTLMNGRLSQFGENPFAIIQVFQWRVWLALITGLFTIALLMTSFHFALSYIFSDVMKDSLLNVYETYFFMLTENTFNEGVRDIRKSGIGFAAFRIRSQFWIVQFQVLRDRPRTGIPFEFFG